MNSTNNCGTEVPNSQKAMGAAANMFLEKEKVEKKEKKESLFAKMEAADQGRDFAREKAELEAEKRKVIREVLDGEAEKTDNYTLGFIGALLGGLVGMIPWVLCETQGFSSVLLGALIAFTSSKGYDFMKVKKDEKKIWFIGITTVISVFIGRIVSDMILIATDPELSVHFSEIFLYYAKHFGEYLSVNFYSLLMGFAFAGMGIYLIFLQMKKEAADMEKKKLECMEETEL